MKWLRLIGVADREWARLESTAVLSFVLMAGLAFARAGRDALFIKTAGVESLPLMYVINGLLMAVFAALYARLAPAFSLHRVLIVLGALFGALVLLFRLLLSSGNPLLDSTLPYAIWSAAQLYQIVLLMHFWTFCNHVFDPREARRLFPVIGGAGLAGMITGSLLTPVVVAWIGAINVILVWALLSLTASGLVPWAVKNIRASGMAIEHSPREHGSFFEEARELWQIPLLRLLIFIAFPMWITAWLIDFQFFQTLDSVYPGQDALAGFLGLFNGLTSIAGLLIQFFLTARIVQWLGVGGAALVYPGVMMGAAAGLVARTAIPAAPTIYSPHNVLGVAGKFSDETLFSSLHDSVLSMLFNSLPDERRTRARALLAGVMEPVATSLAGLLLMGLTAFSVPPAGTAVITVVLGILWVTLALRIKRLYLAALVNNLNSRNVDMQRAAFRTLSEDQGADAQRLLIAALSSGDEEMALFALSVLKPSDPVVASALCRYLPDASEKLKTSMMQALLKSGYVPGAAAFAHELARGSPEIRALALRGLISLDQAPDHFLLRYVDDADPVLASVAVEAGLFRAGELGAEARKRLSKMLASKKDAESILGLRILEQVPQPGIEAVKLLSRKNPEVRTAAVRALGARPDREGVVRLAALLADDSVALPARESLLAHKELSLPALHATLSKIVSSAQNDFKVSLIECIGEIAQPDSIEVLSRFLVKQPILVENAAALALSNIRLRFLADDGRSLHEADALFSESLRSHIRTAYFAIVENWKYDLLAAESLHAANRDHRLDLLADALKRFSRLRLEAAVRFLELISDPRSIRALSSDLLSGDMRARAESLEALEGTCAEAGVIVRAMEEGSAESIALLKLHDVLTHALTRNYPPWISACAAHAAGLIGAKSVEREVFAALAHPSEQVQLCAYRALALLKSKLPFAKAGKGAKTPGKKLTLEIKKMDSMMERFLFLRSVPLFSDVDGTDLQWINEITHEQKFRARQTIFREGDPGESLYIIVSGSVRVFKGQKGREITIDILEERDCFGEMAILDQEPRSASVMTMKNARLLVIHRSDFQRLLLARPRISFSLFKTMSKRVREANARFLNTRKAESA